MANRNVIRKLSDKELENYIKSDTTFVADAVQYAYEILKERGRSFSESEAEQIENLIKTKRENDPTAMYGSGKNSFLKTRKIALYISSTYVGIGTLAVCSIAGGDLLYGEWSIPVLMFTIPVTFFSFIYRFFEADYLIPVFIIQFIMFLFTFFIIALFIKDKPKKN
ncbi:hypothetical protein LZQ00_10900 [Sphingobacterium sp. SRCM116780]|uniref:hypothetical protein n=1 Tax=Sphingobacterium sp. SRCM116780 TaxID=2907623 RepID=UPI001F208594|nr:hypothetical protein [Sphingobacterium sp. SRCM116780]UIR54784.1 hypothetical protein LZQ00_10900 [Sphingobacterium sp. SRCM116780]